MVDDLGKEVNDPARDDVDLNSKNLDNVGGIDATKLLSALDGAGFDITGAGKVGASSVETDTLDGADIANASAGQVPESDGSGGLQMGSVGGGGAVTEESGSPYTATGSNSATNINPSSLDSFDSYYILCQATDQGSSGNNVSLQIDGETGANYSEIQADGTQNTSVSELGPLTDMSAGDTISLWLTLSQGRASIHNMKMLTGPTGNTTNTLSGTQKNTAWPPSQFTFKRGVDTDWRVRIYGRDA